MGMSSSCPFEIQTIPDCDGFEEHRYIFCISVDNIKQTLPDAISLKEIGQEMTWIPVFHPVTCCPLQHFCAASYGALRRVLIVSSFVYLRIA